MTKKVVFLILLSILGFQVKSQDTFIKEIQSNFFGEASIVSSADGGGLILSADAMQLMKYNQCGDLEWAFDLGISNTNCCIGEQIVTSSTDKIFILSRESNTTWGARVTCLSPNGSVVWSKLLSRTSSDFFPYSLIINDKDEIYVHGNFTPIGGGNPYISLTKIDEFGVIIASNHYTDGNIWGAAIATDDGGTLMRRGDLFIKLKETGIVEWNVDIRSVGTYYYSAPIEVSDGFIFTKYKNGGNEIGFYKIDKLGNLLWGGGRFTNFQGIPKDLKLTPNGNFTTLFFTDQNSVYAKSIIMEFDKDLNLIKSNAIKLNKSNTYLNDLDFIGTENLIVCGKTSVPMQQHFIFGKLDVNYQSGCDTIMTVNFQNEPATTLITPINPVTLAVDWLDSPITTTSINFKDTLLCSKTKVRTVNLGSDSLICDGDSVVLKNYSSDNFTEYNWSTGQSSESINVKTPGTYWLEASNPCVSLVFSDTIIISVDSVTNPNLITDSVLCGDATILLNAEITGGGYSWQDNTTAPEFLVSQPGNYYVDISLRLCEKRFFSTILSCEDFLIPNIFTPNGDGINDYFGANYEGLEKVTIEIYNRWGILLFQTSINGFSWDGTVNGQSAPDGLYFYVIQIGADNYQGSVTLMR